MFEKNTKRLEFSGNVSDFSKQLVMTRPATVKQFWSLLVWFQLLYMDTFWVNSGFDSTFTGKWQSFLYLNAQYTWYFRIKCVFDNHSSEISTTDFSTIWVFASQIVARQISQVIITIPSPRKKMSTRSQEPCGWWLCACIYRIYKLLISFP